MSEEANQKSQADKMKMPPGDNHGNANEQGFFNNYEEPAYFFEQVEVTETGVPISPADDTTSTAAEADFSEYMWMEHMEEFDREVMKKLEEEALMEECLNFNAMLEHERIEPTNDSEQAPRHLAESGDTSKMLENLHLDESGSASNSTLNPLAAEFVPANKTGRNEVPKKKDP